MKSDAPTPGRAASMSARTGPEVLAPAGDMDCVRAAVENGADAIYFGLSRHNARARATNFTIEELPELMAFLRLRGVKGYIAFNTLIFSDELDDAAKDLERILACGPDALIVQDLGVLRLARAISPDIVLHASTQATVTCAEELAALEELGVSRVILARELTIQEIGAIHATTSMELEVFAHGALCIAYSGQCLTSEALGGRSANRGACAQACRLPYDMIVDGQVRDLGSKKYLLSPQDLAAYDVVPQLIDAGVAGLKIEGRLKTAEYVAATTRAYRKAVDEGAAARWSREEVGELEQVFSRGLSHGFLSGIDHQALVPALSPKKRGPFLGIVTSVRPGAVALKLENPLKPGDGVSFDDGHPDDEAGGRIFHVWKDRTRVDEAGAGDEVALGFGTIDWTRIRVGQRVWKTSDPALEKKLRASFEKTGRRVRVDATVSGAAGTPMVLELGSVRVESTEPLQVAHKRPLDEAYLREQIGRLGTTPFELGTLTVNLEGDVMLPVRLINDLRRTAAEKLIAARRERPAVRIASEALASIRPPVAASGAGPAELIAMCRTPDQFDAALEGGFRAFELDFEDIKKYREAVPRGRERKAWMALAPPRIHKPSEGGLLRLVQGCKADAIVVRNLAHLDFFRGEADLIGDFSLNISNELAAAWYLGRGLSIFTPSHDLNAAQLESLLRHAPADRAETVVHLHMPMFHMEHCVIAAGLSNGHDASDCGRPCDRHRVALRDRVGMSHPVMADVGCRNTVFNAVPQSASPYVERFRSLGVRRFRVELMTQPGPEAVRLLRAYQELLQGKRDGAKLWKELRSSDVVGVTRGPLGREE